MTEQNKYFIFDEYPILIFNMTQQYIIYVCHDVIVVTKPSKTFI